MGWHLPAHTQGQLCILQGANRAQNSRSFGSEQARLPPGPPPVPPPACPPPPLPSQRCLGSTGPQLSPAQAPAGPHPLPAHRSTAGRGLAGKALDLGRICSNACRQDVPSSSQSLAGAEGKLLLHPFPKGPSRIQLPTGGQKQDHLLCWLFFKEKRVTLFLCSVLRAGTPLPWLHQPLAGHTAGLGAVPCCQAQDTRALGEDASRCFIFLWEMFQALMAV